MKIHILITLFIFMFSTSLTTADEIKLLSDVNGFIRGLEIIDKDGRVIKKIPDREKIISESIQNSKYLTPKISTLVAKNNILVTVSQFHRLPDNLRIKTGIPGELDVHSSLYDLKGNLVKQFKNLPCQPITFSKNAELFICYYEPYHDPDGYEYGANAPEHRRKTRLYIYEFKKDTTWSSYVFPGVSDSWVLLSPNGKWVYFPGYGYLYSLANRSKEPFRIVKKNKKRVNRIGDNGELMKDTIKIYFNEQGESIREITKTQKL